MNRRVVIFIAVIAIIMYVFTIAFFAFKLISFSQQGRESLIDQCTDITQHTFDLMHDYNDSSTMFNKTYTAILEDFPHIATVLLEDEQGVFYTYPVQSPLVSKDEMNKTVIKTQSPLISVFSSTLLVNSKPMTLTIALYHVSPVEMHEVAKKSFLILFITTLSVLLVIIINKTISMDSVTDNTTQSGSSEQFQFPDYINNNADIFNDDFSFNDLDLSLDKGFETDDSYSFENAHSYTDNLQMTQEQSPVKKEHNNTQEETPDVKNVNTTDQPCENYKNLENNNRDIESNTTQPTKKLNTLLYKGKPISDPLGLFSEKTGFGWESYLETRLDAELIRASSSEQDLALVIVRIVGIEHYPAYMEFISETLLNAFKFRDLIFEYGDDAFACIHHDLQVDKAIELSESLYRTLQEKLKHCDVKIVIGISTRSLRIIPGTRILQEAQQAVEKALGEKDYPIIAFKANPDKYKTFVYEKT